MTSEERKKVKRKDKKDLENFLADYWKEKSFNPTVEEVFNEWNDRRCNLGNIASQPMKEISKHSTDTTPTLEKERLNLWSRAIFKTFLKAKSDKKS